MAYITYTHTHTQTHSHTYLQTVQTVCTGPVWGIATHAISSTYITLRLHMTLPHAIVASE